MKYDLIISWLKNAYAMERSIAQVLTKQLNHQELTADLQSKLQEHLLLTQHHAELVKSRIETLGGEVSKLQTGMAQLLGKTQNLMTNLPDQKIVADTIADYAGEHFEIATYATIVHAATALGDNETATICQNILRDEIDMATWLYEHLATIVQPEVFQLKQPA